LYFNKQKWIEKGGIIALQWRIKEKEAIAKAKEMELKKEGNIYTGNQTRIPVFQRLVQIFFKKEKGNVRS